MRPVQGLVKYAENHSRPTEDQFKALSALNNFFKSDKRCFLLKGYAGTGKTFLTKCIADYLKEENVNTVLMAPTGRASQILQTKTKHRSTTIHKGIYNLDEVDETKTNKNGKEKYKFKYNLRHKESTIRNIYLIDEASMISDKYSEDDFFIFGSGRLLKDLISYISPTNANRRDQIIFIGDPAQLPPVTDRISGALNASYLKETFDIETSEYELTQVVRQQKESGILSNATYIRKQLQTEQRNSFELNTSFPDTINIQAENTVETFLTENRELSSTKSIVINYSNKSALDYNLRIRERLFSDKMQIEVGDVLMINQNNYNYVPELLNGMMVKVIEISPIPEIKTNMKSYDQNGDDCRITHKFRRIKIAVPTDEGNVEVNCSILENFLYSPNPSLDYAENIALYLDFKKRNPSLRPKTKEFADTLRRDPYFNALRVKYGYAITCHKAQGGEWDSVIVNLDVNQGKLSDNFLRWTYTAITRASQKLYLFNVPKENQFSTLKYTHNLIDSPIAAPIVKEIRYALPIDFKEIQIRLGLENGEPFKQEKLIEVLAISNSENVKVFSRLHHDFQEIYVFEKDSQKAGLSFWYNGKNKFTTIQIAPNHTTDNIFASMLKSKFEEQVNILLVEKDKEINDDTIEGQEEKTNMLFGEKYKAHQTLYNELTSIFKAKEISIDTIEHGLYKELYTIKRNKEIAVILFDYDGLDRFTHAKPLINHCNSNGLLIEINDAIIELKKR